MRRDRIAATLVAAAAAAVFAHLLDYPFLNWDDQDVFVRNEALHAPGLAGWAFTTRYMEHYQPAAWLIWGALARTVGLTAATAHALTVALHALCAAGVYVVIREALALRNGGRPAKHLEWVAAASALVWAVHPLRVEVVAWASAMPYTLALLAALLATWAWMRGRVATALACLVASLLARPIAIGLPLVWVAIGPWRAAGIGLALAAAAGLVESSARLSASLAEFGIGPRLTLAAAAPWTYLWRTVAPVGLTPLDPLALTPRADPAIIGAGFAATALVSALAWRWRRIAPVPAAAWLAYLALLAPAMGLVPSGLQATADRYVYVAGVPLSVALAAALAARARSAAPKTAGTRVSWLGLSALGVVLILAGAAWRHSAHWRDSVALWTRAVTIDPRNDVALYNLATALAEAGQRDAALTRYDELLQLVPAHADARRNRALLRAQAAEEEGNALAARGRLAEAVDRYGEATTLDPRRTHSHAARGMALVELGRLTEAGSHLRIAIEQGVADPAVPNALAYVLVQAGDRAGALAVLREARRRFPADENIARNLALLGK